MSLHLMNSAILIFVTTFQCASTRKLSPWASLNSPGTALSEVVTLEPDRRTDDDLERISIPVAYHNVEEEVETFPERRPYATNLFIATLKGFAADGFVQLGEISAKGTGRYDWRRGVLFTLFGLLYAGVVEWIIYVDIFSVLCPHMLRFANESWDQKAIDRAGQLDVLKQIMFDNFVHYTFVYYPIFYALKEVVQGPSGFDISFATLRNSMHRYRRNALLDLCRIWLFNVPFDVLLFTTPMWLRMPVNHAIGFVWTMLLSAFRGEKQADELGIEKALSQTTNEASNMQEQQADSLESQKASPEDKDLS